jgi:hypothetical protein
MIRHGRTKLSASSRKRIIRPDTATRNYGLALRSSGAPREAVLIRFFEPKLLASDFQEPAAQDPAHVASVIRYARRLWPIHNLLRAVK